MATRKIAAKTQAQTGAYTHSEAKAIIRPEVGVQSHAAAKPKFRREPASYRYDSSLAPQLQWDEGNPARERGEALIARIAELADALAGAGDAKGRGSLGALRTATDELRAVSRPFLDWAGKAERLRRADPAALRPRAAVDQGDRRDAEGHRASRQIDCETCSATPTARRGASPPTSTNGWVNRLILGDSLVVMNSLLHYERLGGQVQMIYIDPPYGVKFGSNFQPFVRKRDVKHNDDEDLTREPEMVKAYRDTWELGLHSYLTYMRDRLLLARELLTPSGSVFVQISDENLHHVRS